MHAYVFANYIDWADTTLMVYRRLSPVGDDLVSRDGGTGP
jgi:hypothetical protein